MANQVAARLSGDDYQHLYAWHLVLSLKMPNSLVQLVIVENERAGSFDDVTIHYDPTSVKPDEFHQVKYHVDQRNEYSSASFTEKKENQSSLLEKFFRTWKSVKSQRGNRPFHLTLISNWAWAESDSLREFIEGHENRIKEALFDEGPKSKAGTSRDAWRDHLGADIEEFKEFIRSLRIKLGFDSGAELAERVSERMMFLGLKYDISAQKVCVGIIREWITRGKQEITSELLDDVIKSHRLLRTELEKSVVVYLSTIKERTFDVLPDHEINWREHFEGTRFVKGHALKEGRNWNDDLLPDIYEVESLVGATAGCRLIRARGFARLSPWFAFGHVFSEVSGYTIELDQNGRLWRTDSKPSEEFEMLVSASSGQIEDGPSDVLATGISITGDIEPRVREYLQESKTAGSLLLLHPNKPLGMDCLQSNGDVVRFAQRTKQLIREAIESKSASKILLFYYGPFSGASFLGHCLNAMGSPIQVMEDQAPGYAPSFLLR